MPKDRASLKSFFRGHMPLEHETMLFIFASALDVFMTYIQLSSRTDSNTRTRFVESNPIARFFLDSWGVKGLIYFKFAVVAFVAVIVQIISTKRPETGRWVLRFATALIACVVIYSLMLYLRGTGRL
jgi:hypothetical protein